jgi:hypothetical protein
MKWTHIKEVVPARLSTRIFKTTERISIKLGTLNIVRTI